MLIALEGADGCGKTTLCAILAKRIGAIGYSTPPKKYLAVREGVDKNAPAEEHYQFYRDGIYDASDEIHALIQNGHNVVSDRYWLTTYVYHQVMGVPVSKNDFVSVIQPNLTVILSLNHNVQVKRMLHRGMSEGDRRMLDKQQEITNAFFRNVLEFGISFVVIDTQRFSPDQCADIVIAAMKD